MDKNLESKLEKMVGKQTEFSFIGYRDPKRMLMKILLDENTQFVAEVIDGNFDPGDKCSGLLFHTLFKKKDVKGNISIPKIMHDAKPIEPALATFFKPCSNSLYKVVPPDGINAGKVTFLSAGRYGDRYRLLLGLYSLSVKNNISGAYTLEFTNESINDTKNSPCRLILVYKSRCPY